MSTIVGMALLKDKHGCPKNKQSYSTFLLQNPCDAADAPGRPEDRDLLAVSMLRVTVKDCIVLLMPPILRALERRGGRFIYLQFSDAMGS